MFIELYLKGKLFIFDNLKTIDFKHNILILIKLKELEQSAHISFQLDMLIFL